MTPDVTVLYDSIRWEEKSLFEAGKRRGSEVRLQNCRSLALRLDETAPDCGAVLQRCVSYYRNVHSTAALEGMGVRVVNRLETGIAAGNKLYAHMRLQRHGVPTPQATVAFSMDAALKNMEADGYPRIVKPTVGSWGRMISKLNSGEAAEGILESREAMYPIYQVHYIEEFVRRPPRDIRAIVVGDSVVAAIYRSSANGSWKTNMALGGVASSCPVTGELEDICIKARQAVAGEIVGVDLMESDERGLVVHEVNNTTEFKNTVRVCGIDVPSLMLDYVLGA